MSGLTPSTSGQTTNKPSSVPVAAVPSRSSQTKPSGGQQTKPSGGHQTKPSGGHQTKPKSANTTSNIQSQNKSKLFEALAAKSATADATGSKRKAENDDENLKVKVIKSDVVESPQEDVSQTESILNDVDDANAYEEEFIPEENDEHPVDNFVNVVSLLNLLVLLLLTYPLNPAF